MPSFTSCRVCHKAIKHHPAQKRTTCSMRCRGVHISRLYRARGQAPKPQAFAARQAAGKRRVEQVIGTMFGAMTERECKIFNEGVKVGYRKGYHRAQIWFRRAA